MVRDVGRTAGAIREIAQASQGETSYSDLLERICGVVSSSFDFDRVSVARYYPGVGEVTNLALVGDTPDRLPARLPIERVPLLARALETQQIVYVADVRAEPAIPQELVDAYGVTSVLCVPLMSAGHCLGFLAADRRGEPFELDETESTTIEMIGVITATLLEKVLVHEELQRLASIKTEFVAIASHELRTPLSSIYGISVTLDERGDELSDTVRHELRRTLREQTERLRELVEQLLDLSRFDVAAREITPERHRLLPRLQKIVELVAADHAVAVDVHPGLEASVDPVAFDRIVSNLISNALRYGRPPIIITATADESQLRVAVEDHGAGVDDAFVPQLFERFSRSPDSAASVTGSGLGLAIARAYANAHGGDLFYEHAQPHGARFVLALPRGGNPSPTPIPAAAVDSGRKPMTAWPDQSHALRFVPVVVLASPPAAAAALQQLLEDYHAQLIGTDRIEVEPIDDVRRGTVIYRVMQASQTVANQFGDSTLYFVAEDGNRWRLPPPAL